MCACKPFEPVSSGWGVYVYMCVIFTGGTSSDSMSDVRCPILTTPLYRYTPSPQNGSFICRTQPHLLKARLVGRVRIVWCVHDGKRCANKTEGAGHHFFLATDMRGTYWPDDKQCISLHKEHTSIRPSLVALPDAASMLRRDCA